ncbi:MAG: hypothetical protein WA877_00160, partial [Legionella sp.]
TIAQGIGQITSDQQQDHILFEMLPFETEHRRTPKNLEILPVPKIFCDKTTYLLCLSKSNGKMESTHAQLGLNYLSVTNIF